MANFVSVVMQFLTPDMIAKIASALGLDRTVAQKAVGGAVPALLSSLADAATTPGGVRQLSNILAQQQSGSLDTIKNLLEGSSQDQKALAMTGAGLLSSLFGGGVFGTMAQAIAKFSGIDEGASQSMLGMLAPVVFGALGQQQRSAGLDAGGLASQLISQKDQIAAAIPSGLMDQLSAAGLVDKAEGHMRSGAAATSAAGGRIIGASEQKITGIGREAYATAGKTSSQLPYWLAGLAVLAGVAWFVVGRTGNERVAELPRPAATQPAGTVGMAAPNLTVGGVNLANEVNSSVGALRSALPGITDAASAQAALPSIQQATAQLNDVNTRAANLAPEGRIALAKLIAVATPSVNQMCDKALATPGVAAVAKPAIDELRSRLDTLSRV